MLWYALLDVFDGMHCRVYIAAANCYGGFPKSRQDHRTLPTWLHILAVLLHVPPACLCQDDVIPEVCDLHELVVKHLLSTRSTGHVVLLVLQVQEQDTEEEGGLCVNGQHASDGRVVLLVLRGQSNGIKRGQGGVVVDTVVCGLSARSAGHIVLLVLRSTATKCGAQQGRSQTCRG
jgi:hypothetical protein